MTARASRPHAHTAPKLEVVPIPQTRVFSMNAISSPADIPEEAWPELRMEFIHLNLQKGDVPHKSGNVMVGKVPPVADWHPNFLAVLRQFENRPVMV